MEFKAVLGAIESMERPELLQLRRAIQDRLDKINDEAHAEVAVGMNLPPGWGANDETDG